MKASELAIKMSGLHEEVEETINGYINHFNTLFVGTSNISNEDVAAQATLHDAMSCYLISSMFSAYHKKQVDQSKKALDACISAPDGIAGQTILLGKSNCFQFAKKQNQDGETILVVDLVTALARAGVPKEQVDAALKEATKAKRGNVYYQVTVVED
jgi:hypothetical protein